MNDTMIRFWQPSDLPDLREIFSACFGDPPETAEAFHRTFLAAPENCMLATVPEDGRPEGRPAAAAYCLPGAGLCFPERRIPSVYLYAFGCLPEYRGRGLMKRVYTALFEEAGRQAPASCIIPASDALMQAYNRSGFTFAPLGRIRAAEIGGTAAREAESLPAERIPWREYALRREEWLKPYPHADYPDSFYELSAEYGYVFLSMPGALAAVLPLEDRCIAAELLCPSADPARALAGAATIFPAEIYEVRTPAFFPGPGEICPYAYWRETSGTMSGTGDFWYPFGLE